MAGRLRFSAAHAYRHLRAADPVVGALIEQDGPFGIRPSGDPYGSLVRTILFQQLAGPAAMAIQHRWYALYGDDQRTPAPEDVVATADEQFRGAGVSRQKAGYLRDVATHVIEGTLDFDAMEQLPDEDVVDAITAVHGLGEWSAHMFLMTVLGRPEVLPVGDVGVRNGMRVAYDLEESPTPAQALEIGAPWAPYRSVGSWYMWRAMATVTPDAAGE